MSNSPRGRERPEQPSLDIGGEQWREQVRERALPVLESWSRGGTIDAIRGRLQGVLGASGAVVLIRLLLDPGGLTGTLITAWFFLSLPVAAVAGSLLVLLRDPTNAADVWFEESLFGALGLVALAGLARGSESSSEIRAVWQLLFGDDLPTTEGDTGSDVVSQESVAEVRRVVWVAILGSAGVVAADQLVLGGSLGGAGAPAVEVPSVGLGLTLSPVESALLLAGGVVVGAVVGALLAVTTR